MFTKRELKEITEVAYKAAIKAGEIHSAYFRKKIFVREKEAAGLVTEVDVKSEALIKEILFKHYPEFIFFGEEGYTGKEVFSDLPVWHVDPLDGTTNFVHGFPVFCVSIGLAIRDTPLVGVIHAPILQETFWGYQDGGAFRNMQRIFVSSRRKLCETLLTTGFAYSTGKKLREEIKLFHNISSHARAVRRPGAAAMDLAYVASGVFDGFWERNLHSWDLTAGSLLVREAGGIVTNYAGKNLSLHGGEILAANKTIHKAMLHLLK